MRQPTWKAELEGAVLELRRRHPRWGKDQPAGLLAGQGAQVAGSMVGRLLSRLQRRGRLGAPRPHVIAARRGWQPRPYAVRKPRD